MDENTSTPFVTWEYDLRDCNDEIVDLSFYGRRRKNVAPIGPGTGWFIEFQGQTLAGEMILARYLPSDDQDAREWLAAFDSGSLPPIRVSIDTYLGPSEEPEDDEDDDTDSDSAHPGADLVEVAHTIYIGDGFASQTEDGVIITVPPEIFREAAGSLLLGYRSKYEYIEQRIFDIFIKLSPQGYTDFWEAFERPVYPNDVFSFNDECREALWRDRPIGFDRPSGFDCLQMLHSASGGVVTYTMLTKALRPEGVRESVVFLEAPLELKSCISHLRASLKAVDCSCEISNVRRLGYRLIPSR